jgi:GNAT superfamily N-acetyltransferase
MAYDVTTWYFEMRSQGEFRPAQEIHDLDVKPLTHPLGSFVRFLWHGVGDPWAWADRSSWTDDAWQHLVEQRDMHIWVGYRQGTPVGYFELRQSDEPETRDVEILYFGLLPQFIGNGYGGHLLNEAIRKAWQLDTSRVWLHTCNFDGPNAVKNYLARGFVQYDEKHTVEEIPALDARGLAN